MNYTIDESSGLLTFYPDDTAIECGFEIGNWLSYVSAGRDKTKAIHNVVNSQTSAGKIVMAHKVALGDYEFHVEQEERISNSILRRQFTVTPITLSLLGDFVVRFSFSDCGDADVIIDGKTITHQNRNIYHQYETDRVEIEGSDGRFEVETTDLSIPDGMDYVMYARDEPPDTWVIHARALTRNVDRGVLRFHRGPVSHFRFLDWLVSHSTFLSDQLRYLRERSSISSRYIPIQYGERTRLTSTDLLQIGLIGKYYDK